MGKKWPVPMNLPFFAVVAYARGGSESWNNRKGGTAEGGTRREPLPNATQARMDTYPIRIKTGLDTYQNAFSIVESMKTLSTCPKRTVAPDARPRPHFCGTALCGTPLSIIPRIRLKKNRKMPSGRCRYQNLLFQHSATIQRSMM